jgi:hypothetical protein
VSRFRVFRQSNPQSLPAKGCGTLFFGIFALAGLFLSGLILVSFARGVRPYFWKATPCTIIESHPATDTLEPTSKSAEPIVIRYRYEVDGRSHDSTRLDSGGIKESLNSREIQRLLFKYEADTNSLCYVNPGNPDEAVLRRVPLWTGFFILLPLLFVGIGVGGIIGIWRGEQWRNRIIKRTTRSNAMGTGAKLIFFGVFALVGGILTYFIAVRPLQKYFSAKSWPATPCEILSSSVGAHRGDKGGATYSIDITYRYQVRGRSLQSDTYSVMTGSSSGRSSKAAVVARYPVGSEAVCYVNPEDPTDALLSRDLTPWLLIGLLPGVFLLIGLIGLGSMIRPALQRFRERSTMPILPGLPGVIPTPTTPSITGPVVLNPEQSPTAKFAGAIFVALFWNGVTGVFVWVAVNSFIEKKPEWFLTIFITPFVLIGLLLLGLVVSTFLNLFNPRIQLTVNSRAIPLGGTLDASWLIPGWNSRIKRFKLTLEGRQETTHGSGKTRRTDRNVFATLPLADTSDPLQIAQGRSSVEIPDNHKPSQSGDNSKIVWTLKAVGEIPLYPDLEEEFELTVLAREVR